MGFFSSIGSGIAKGLDFVTAVSINPIKAITHPIEATNNVTQLRADIESGKKSGYETIKNIGVTTAINVGTTLVPAGKVAQLAKTAVSTFKGAVITGAVAPVVATAVLQNPSAIYSAPQKVFDFQTDLGSLVKKESTKEEVWAFLKEHPYLTATTALGALLAAGFVGTGLFNFINSYYNRKATDENTRAIEDSKKNVTPVNKEKVTENVYSQTPNIINIYQTPVSTPADASIPISAPAGEQATTSKVTTKKKTTKKKKKKTTKKKKKKTTKKKKKRKSI